MVIVTFAVICWGKIWPIHLFGFVLKLDILTKLGPIIVSTVVRQFCNVIVLIASVVVNHFLFYESEES